MPRSIGPIRQRLVTALLCAVLSGCTWNFPYSIPIQQGNVVTVEMLQELELGMDKRKVKFILGTPLVTDAFHQDRWDYYYSFEHGSADRVQQRASLYFEGDKLVRIDADIDSRIDFHTVTDASENVLIVPKRKKGFFAAVTPAFIEREEAEAREEEIERALDSGFNEPQPGSGATAASDEILDPVQDPTAAATATVGPGLGEQGIPSELYAPNSTTEIGAAGPWSVEPAARVEPISAETRSQSRYLEDLFADFGKTRTEAAVPETADVVPSVVTESEFSPQPTRD